MIHASLFIILSACCPNDNCRSLSTLSTSVDSSLSFILLHNRHMGAVRISEQSL